MRRFAILIVFSLAAFAAFAQATLTENKLGFCLVDVNGAVPIFYDGEESVLMQRVANLFADDVQRVSGKRPMVLDSNAVLPKLKRAVVVGTLGNKWIKRLSERKLIDVQGVEGFWERYRIQRVKHPGHGLSEAIVVVGSDRRGAAYGLLSISRSIGVSPWYFWSDAPIKHRETLRLNVLPYTSKSPSVKYRGIFINDEDWGLYPWVRDTFEKNRKNFGPRTYAAVCELLLRLNANYLCPAMHNCSTAFYKVPENKLVADSFGIVMGTSHCEPLFLNTATEWDHARYGEWNYTTNKKGIDSVLEARVKETTPFENVYTLALRGLHDVAMKGSDDMNERRKVMEQAIEAQRDIIERNSKKNIEKIPQAFTPYKEVLDVYDHGLRLPDDVTIIWPDDNYGYMKRLSNPTEQQRSGRSGVYYHASYLGRPHNYLWMNTTSPTLMYEELRKAYDCTADRIWLLNAGDIKLAEFATDFFLSLAYDINSFDFERAAHYRTEWTMQMIGAKCKNELDDIFNSFYTLAFQRKPECMGFGAQWTNDAHGREINVDTEFSFANYGEAERRIAEYRRIADLSGKLMKQLPESNKACFFENVYYPVKGCELINRMVLYGQLNRQYAFQNRAATETWAKRAIECFDSLETITRYYNTMLNGKWNHVVSMEQENTSSYFDKPELRKAKLSDDANMAIFVENEELNKGASSFHILPSFNKYIHREMFADIYNRGNKMFEWVAKPSETWIRLSKCSGKVKLEERLMISIDWEKVPHGERVAGYVDVVADNGQKERIFVSVFNPDAPSLADVKGCFLETNGYISINAAQFQHKHETENVKIAIVDNLGCEGKAVQLGNPIASPCFPSQQDAPYVEYDFYCFSEGIVDVYTYVLPTYTLNNDRGYAGHERTNIETHYGVTIDNTRIIEASTSSFEYAQNWYESILRNCRINKSTLYVPCPGKHKLRVLCGDTGTILQKVVLDFGGLKRSYMGPLPTFSE